jgi:hypothetical protein
MAVSYRGANLIRMTSASENVRGSAQAQARDAAARRLRRITRLSVALMVAAGGVFTALAAGSTHAKKTTVLRRREPSPAAAAAVLVQAPAPPLVGVRSASPSPSQAPAPSSVPATPLAPAPAYQPPVVVSGGS